MRVGSGKTPHIDGSNINVNDPVCGVTTARIMRELSLGLSIG